MKPYYKEVFDYVNTFHSISDSVFKQLYSFAKYKVLKPNEKLLRQGVVPQKVYLIVDGVIRSYLVMDSGKEITTALHYPFMIFGSFKALLKKESTSIIYEALTACHVYEIDFANFYEVCTKNIDVMTFYTKFLESIVLKKEERYIELSYKDAKARYLTLRERISNLDNIIPQYQIAASLGITPVQLSRIRSKL